TDAFTADSGKNALVVASAISRASVVLPVPCGPHKMTDDSRSYSISRRSGFPSPSKCSCPTTSSSRAGRKRAASGAWRLRRSAAAAENRSLDERKHLFGQTRHLLVGLLVGVAREVREEDEVLQRQRVLEELDA